MSLKRTARSLLAVASLTLIIGAAAGCSSSKKSDAPTGNTSNLPAATTLLSQAATAMGSVQSVQFNLTVDGTLSQLPISAAKGVLTHEGNAQGTAAVSELGQRIELSFILVGQTFYLKGPTGGYTSMSLQAATQVFDPSAILDPNRGIPKILSTATNAKTISSTTMDGGTAYEVQVTVDPAAVDSLIPGAGTGTTGNVWIDQATGHVDKAVFTVPQTGKPVTVTIELTNYDQPVTINAP